MGVGSIWTDTTQLSKKAVFRNGELTMSTQVLGIHSGERLKWSSILLRFPCSPFLGHTMIKVGMNHFGCYVTSVCKEWDQFMKTEGTPLVHDVMLRGSSAFHGLWFHGSVLNPSQSISGTWQGRTGIPDIWEACLEDFWCHCFSPGHGPSLFLHPSL